MQKPRVLILGGTGMLGSTICRSLARATDLHFTTRGAGKPNNSIGTHHPGLDAHQPEKFLTLVEKLRPNEVVNCIGLIKQRPEGKDPIACIRINSLFPHLVAATAKSAGARVITFGTDCVFSGRDGNYGDDSVSDAEDIYGKSKFVGELTEAPGLTIRSSIIGPELNSQLSLFEWFRANKGGAVKGYTGAMYSGLTTLEMSRLVSKMIFEHPKLFGRWTVASPTISKFELLEVINDIFELNIKIAPESDFKCDRSLDGSRFTRETGYAAPPWRTMIQDLKNWLGEAV
jgi:dTDP-4-dehydrorhamnose reductase